MTREQAKKLLGGYAAGSLTTEESQALFEAALEDQELFDALAREQSLKELLDDPAARGTVLAALEGRGRTWWQRLAAWTSANAVAVASIAGIFFVSGYAAWQIHSYPPTPRLIAYMDRQSITVDGSAEDVPFAKATRKFVPPTPVAKPNPLPLPPAPDLKQKDQPQMLAQALPPALVAAPPALPLPAPLRQVELLAAERPNKLEIASEPARKEMVVQGFRPKALASIPGGSKAVTVEAGAATIPMEPSPVQAPPVAVTSASAGRGSASLQRAPSAVARLQVERRTPNGFEPADAASSFAAGDVIRLRVEPDRDGVITVLEEGSRLPLLAGARAQRGVAVYTGEIRLTTGTKAYVAMVNERARVSDSVGRVDKADSALAPAVAPASQPTATYRITITAK